MKKYIRNMSEEDKQKRKEHMKKHMNKYKKSTPKYV